MIEKRFGGNQNGASIGDGGMRRKKKGNPKSVGGKCLHCSSTLYLIIFIYL